MQTEEEAAPGIMLAGHPLDRYNGVYMKDSEHAGWPVFKNSDGKYCFHQQALGKWLLKTTHTPDEDTCNSSIAAEEGGALPVGEHTWQCLIDGDFASHTCTVTLLVRFTAHTLPLYQLSHKSVQ